MKSTAKAQAQARELKEKLERRFKGSATIDSVRQVNDAQGWPLLLCSDGGNEAAGQPVIGIRIKAQDAVSKDVFGNDLVAFAPHTIEVAFELDAAEGEPSRRDLIKAMADIAKIGMKIDVKEIADGTAVSAASMDAAAVADSLEVETQWPTKGI
jgi:hypothetical protein